MITRRARGAAVLAGALIIAGCGVGPVSTPAEAPAVSTSPAPASTATVAVPAAPDSTAAALSPTPGPTTSVMPTPAPPTPTPRPTATPPPVYSNPSLVTVLVDSLRVRSKPEISDASIKYKPLLGKGRKLVILSGPVKASGYAWYLVAPLSLPEAYQSGFMPGYRDVGWVAAASREGEPWIQRAKPACPSRPTTLSALESFSPLALLVCFGDTPISFKARVIEQPCDVDGLTVIEPDMFMPYWGGVLDSGHDCGFFVAVTNKLRKSGALQASVGRTVRITGQLAHPGWKRCTTTPFMEPTITGPEGTVMCRLTFVATAIR